uniref:CBS domain-containing protein n=1 Tax=Biomphalaria glabrata TaxID=6526 RepID=A0A2C9LQR2_BIOGL
MSKNEDLMVKTKTDSEEITVKFLLQFVAEDSEYKNYYVDLNTARARELIVKLDLFSAEDIMAFPVLSFDIVEHVPKIAKVLLDYQHNGFPVIRRNKEGRRVCYGLVTRSDLLVILSHKNVMTDGPVEPMDENTVDLVSIGFDEVNKKIL